MQIGSSTANIPIFVAGHNGMVGSAIVLRLKSLGSKTILTASRSDLDLTRQSNVEEWFSANRPAQVYLAAAKVGGIYANNTFPAEFIYDNLAIQANVIHAAHLFGVQKLLFLGSGCIYPRSAPQPMAESALMTGRLEPTNEPYAIAKIAGIKLCESYNCQYGRDYRSAMPTNLYGPGDNFHPSNSHVIPALLRRFHEAVKIGAHEVQVWGTGMPTREFMHVDDLAAASVYLMNLDTDTYKAATLPMESHVNIGSGTSCSIRQLAELIATVTGFRGRIAWDSTKPDGAPQKDLDVTRMNALGWRSCIALEDGLRETYKWFRLHVA